ncbi:LytTR family DNA-binding domain-containing protein [Rhodophyticola porphyridii]|uniref:LytTR family transcriptional regulator n=1 Tax=Rhodophyticola porphyridii TaxID=1852017 RepID=A0A3L9Y8R8_9RHOB|nr:LytTR family DNA-binding domain-containing protein [Rhodophyticola porphyridii]RMA43925.1 LytTR family transcriptional regulator [Rhodophyticola porphyridii]
MGNVVNDTILTETLAEARSLANSGGLWAGLLGTGLLLGLTGPFGTFDDLSLPLRVAYWVTLSVPIYWVGFFTTFVIACWCEAWNIGPRSSVFIGSLVASLPITLMIALAHGFTFGAQPLPEMLRLLPYVSVISVSVSFLTEALAMPGNVQPAKQALAKEPAWLEQLPAELGRELILLQAQDHYLRAETPKGEALIRARLQEATEALGSYGVRLHRSWWAARHAITGLAYRNGVPVVILRDGRVLPVGRTYRRAVRTALR